MLRIREGFLGGPGKLFPGPDEADETAVSRKHKNMHAKKRKCFIGRGSIGKTIAGGVKERETKETSAAVVGRTDTVTLKKFADRAENAATVYTDKAPARNGLLRARDTVKCGDGEYIGADVLINGVKGFRSLFKGNRRTFHYLFEEHFDWYTRYVARFIGRSNLRNVDTIDQMHFRVRATVSKSVCDTDMVA